MANIREGFLDASRILCYA